jgi:hypothetical protein
MTRGSHASARGIRRSRMMDPSERVRSVRRRHFAEDSDPYDQIFGPVSQDEEEDIDMESTMQDIRPRMLNLSVEPSSNSINPMDSVDDISSHIRSLQRLGVINSAQADEAILQSRERQGGGRTLDRISVRRYDDGGSISERIAARRTQAETSRLDSVSRASARDGRESRSRTSQFTVDRNSNVTARRDFILANRAIQHQNQNAARQMVGSSAVHRRLQLQQAGQQGTASAPHRPHTRSTRANAPLLFQTRPSIFSPVEHYLTNPPAISDSESSEDTEILDRAMAVIRREIDDNVTRAQERFDQVANSWTNTASPWEDAITSNVEAEPQPPVPREVPVNNNQQEAAPRATTRAGMFSFIPQTTLSGFIRSAFGSWRDSSREAHLPVPPAAVVEDLPRYPEEGE